MTRIIPQNYPRLSDPDSRDYGLLDDSKLVPHEQQIDVEKLRDFIADAIDYANQKSSREMFEISLDMSDEDMDSIYEAAGKDLFAYFKKYPGDPASSAFQIRNKHYSEVAVDQFRNRMVQKGRMNSGWRYQYLAVVCARESRRFRSVSDIGAAEADFNAVIDFVTGGASLSLYVSVKNRRNTMGGQDWPKAIHALEQVAATDKNRPGPYCCVFGIAMDKGYRYIKREQKTKRTHSDNTEVWLSDFFWPFFANYTYEDVMLHVLDVLIDTQHEEALTSEIELPMLVIESFGEACKAAGLIDGDGLFDDPKRVVQFFVGKG